MNLNDVNEELATAIGVTGVRAYPWAKDQVSPPAAIVMLPTSYQFDQTYGRGSDTATIDVVVLVGRANDRAAFAELATYCDGSGTASVKAALDGGTYTACDSVRTETVTFDVVRVGGVDYLAGTFTVSVFGSGS